MEIQADFKELLASLNAHGVEYLLIGGYALAFHGSPRFTGDLDVWVRPEKSNAQKLLSALKSFGFGSLNLTEDDFTTPDNVVQLGFPPVRIDFLTTISGVEWDEAWPGRIEGRLGDVPVPFIGKKSLIANKRATGRPRDIADLESLGESER